MSEFFATNAPDPSHCTLNSCFSVFRTIWVHFRPLSCLTKLEAKRTELVQKFVPRSRDESFRNERTRSTPLDPKLLFRCVSYHFGLFGTIWLPYQSRSKTKSRRNFSQRTHPIDLVGPQTHVSLRFLLFGCIWDHLAALRNSVQNRPNKCKSRATKSRPNLSQ